MKVRDECWCRRSGERGQEEKQAGRVGLQVHDFGFYSGSVVEANRFDGRQKSPGLRFPKIALPLGGGRVP